MRASGLRARAANFTLGGPGRARTVPRGEGRFLAIISPRRRDAREAEGGALLRRYMGLNPYRGFESLSLRHLPLIGAPASSAEGASWIESKHPSIEVIRLEATTAAPRLGVPARDSRPSASRARSSSSRHRSRNPCTSATLRGTCT